MSAPTFRILFAGQPLPGVARETAVANFARIFKRTPEQAAAAFNGKTVTIKKGLPEAEADRYLQTLEKAGLQVSREAEQATVAELSLLDPDAAPVNAPAAKSDKPVVAAPKINPSLALVMDEDQKAEAAAASTSAGAAPTMICPACQHEQPKADRCDACGIVIAKYVAKKVDPPKEQRDQGSVAAQEAETPAENPSFFGKLFAKIRGN